MKKIIGLILVGFAVFCATSCSARTTAEVVKKEVVTTAKFQAEATAIVLEHQNTDLAYANGLTLYSVPKYQENPVANKKPDIPLEIGDNLIRKYKRAKERCDFNYLI